MNELEKALPELEKLANSLGINTSNAHEVYRAVLANIHVRLQNLEAAAIPVLENAAEQIATDAIEGGK